MKINDLNKIEEGLASSLFGEVPTAAVKGLFTGKGTKATLEQDIFIKDFIGDAIASLDNGIRSGMVANPAKVEKARPTPADVAANRPDSAPPGSPNAPAPEVPNDGTSAAPETPSKFSAAAQKVGSAIGNAAQTGAIATNAIAQRVGNAVSTGAKAAGSAAKKAGNAAKEKAAAGLVKAAGGLPIRVAESKYDRMNYIFESIIEATDPEAPTAQSITQFMTAWFNKYMGGVNWQANKQQLMPMIQNVEATYKKDKGKGALKQLAQAAYATAKSLGATPDGAKNAVKDLKTPADSNPADQSGPTASVQTVQSVRNILPNMEVRDLQALKQDIDEIIASKSKTQYAGNIAPNARPAAKAANPLSAPTITPGTVKATGTAPAGDITKGGASFTRESKRPRK